MKRTAETRPNEIAFNKLYLMNMLAKKNFATYFEAKSQYPMIDKLIEKLTYSEMQFLIDKIEDLM
jgi:hypothetical protein